MKNSSLKSPFVYWICKARRICGGEVKEWKKWFERVRTKINKLFAALGSVHVLAITSISLNFRRTMEVIECLNTYSSHPEFAISEPVHFLTDLMQFIFSVVNNLYSVLQQHNLRNQFVPFFVWNSIQQWESSIHPGIQMQQITNSFCLIELQANV